MIPNSCGAVWPTGPKDPEHICAKVNLHAGPHGCECGATIERGKAYPRTTRASERKN